MRLALCRLLVVATLCTGLAPGASSCPYGLVAIGGEPDPDTLYVATGDGGANGATYAFSWPAAEWDVSAIDRGAITLVLTDSLEVHGVPAGTPIDLAMDVVGYSDAPACCFPGAASWVTIRSGSASSERFHGGGYVPIDFGIRRPLQAGVPFALTVQTHADAPVPGQMAHAASGTTVRAGLRFSNLPPGAYVASCHGYDSRGPAAAPAPGAPPPPALVCPAATAATGGVRFTLASGARVRFDVHDLLGRRVLALDGGERAAGTHALALDPARALAPGVYAVRMRAGALDARARLIVTR